MIFARYLLLSFYLAASVALLFYSTNCYVLLLLYLRRNRSEQFRRGEALRALPPLQASAGLPVVTTQLPIYNEANVVERGLRGAAAIDYPRELHEIQVLDDSTDETRDIIDRTVAELRAEGHRIVVLRREDRSGFKAGALSAGMNQAAGEYIAIFDADFVPPADFIYRTLPHFFADPRMGLVQARWGHINAEESLLTLAQSIGIDGHFMIEQSARTFSGLMMNFNGTAGIWRKAAIVDAGGWSGDTLTEDLDLSYRAQLRQWHTHYITELEAPAELPTTVTAFKSQQFRWAKGSIQTARKLLPIIFRSQRSAWVKLQAALHLTHYAIHPLMLIVAVLAVPIMFSLPDVSQGTRFGLSLILLFSMMGPNAVYLVSQRTLYPRWFDRVKWFPMLMGIGVGLAASNTRAVFEAICGRQSDFIRTPKRGDREAQPKKYRVKTPVLPWIEVGLGLYCAASLMLYLSTGRYLLGPFFFLYSVGFLGVGAMGLWELYEASSPRPVPRLGFPETPESRPSGAS